MVRERNQSAFSFIKIKILDQYTLIEQSDTKLCFQAKFMTKMLLYNLKFASQIALIYHEIT